MGAAAQYIADHATLLEEETIPGDQSNNLTPKTIETLKASGGFRLLLARDLGGEEAHPNDFLEWVMATASSQPSAGWVAGVVGVHPWEISFMHPTLQQEVYGEDPNTLTASPYAPFGVARPVDGGYLLSGEWPYSTGTRYCDWVILGCRVADADGNLPEGPQDVRHIVLPRSDYQIVDDSWNVMGLKGTGSFNVRMQDAFVPEHRVCEAVKVYEGVYASERRPGNPLYGLKFGVMFSAAIAAGTLGIAQGLLRAQRNYMESRVSILGTAAKSDPIHLNALAVAEADFEASRCHLLGTMNELFAHTSAGREISQAQRLNFRRNQVRATDRVFESLAPLSRLAGSAGVWEENGLERWWRDLQTAVTHVCNTRDGAYTPWALHEYGGDLPPTTLY